MEKIIVHFSFPGLSLKTYDRSWEEARKAGYEHPKGLLHHIAGLNGNNVIVIDTWESIEAFNKFSEFLLPTLKRIGFPEVKPIITPVHYEYYGLGEGANRKVA